MAATQIGLQTSLGTCGLSSEALSWRLSAKSPSGTWRKGEGKGEKRERAGASSGPFAWSWGALTEAVWTRQPQPRCACTSSPHTHEMHSSGPRTASKHSSGCQEPEGSLAKQAAAVSPHACDMPHPLQSSQITPPVSQRLRAASTSESTPSPLTHSQPY